MEFIPDHRQFGRIRFLEQSLQMLADVGLVLYVQDGKLWVAETARWAEGTCRPQSHSFQVRDTGRVFKEEGFSTAVAGESDEAEVQG